MKICLVTSSFPANSADTIQAPFIPHVIRELAKRRHSVVVFTQEKPGTDRNWGEFHVERFNGSGFSGRASTLASRPLHHPGLIGRLFWKGTLGLKALHSREKFDVILCCWAVPSGLFARLAAVLGRMPPYAVWALGSDIHEVKSRAVGRAVLRWVLRGAGARFADGLALAEDVRRISGCDCEFLPTFRSLGPGAGSARTEVKRFLFVGRHERIKGIHTLIEALILLHKKRPDLVFAADIVGEGTLTDELRARAAEEGMTSTIRFAGKVDTAALVDYYQSADCVVIPSLAESIPLVMGEAIQCRRPMIVTDVGDMGTLVRKFRLGLVAERPEAGLLMTAMELFLSRPTEPANACWEEALELISIEKSMPKLIRSLERMVEAECA